MTYKKFTDEEIIKALECCFIEQQCNYCPLYKEHSADCLDTVLKNAHALITRQQAEIDRLNKEIQITKDAYTMLQTKIEIIKSEAVKEFAEKLKEKSFKAIRNYGLTKDVVEVSTINNLLKEMVGEEE